MEENISKNDDVIDLRELLQILKKQQKLIVIITSIITLLAIIYAVVAKPVYEVKAMVEMGKIDKKLLANTAELKTKLVYQYGVLSKKKRKFPKVKAIEVGKKSKDTLSIVVEGRDNESAKQYLKSVIEKIETEYTSQINEYIDMQKDLLELTKNDIASRSKHLDEIQNTLNDYNKKMLNITEKDAALAGLFTIQISQNQSNLQALESQISALKAKEYNLNLSISPLKIKQTHLVGEIEVLTKPVKPKKVLIVIVALITGLMLSIFIVFFLNFLQSMKKEDNA